MPGKGQKRNHCMWEAGVARSDMKLGSQPGKTSQPHSELITVLGTAHSDSESASTVEGGEGKRGEAREGVTIC